jgi:hypothetical protein
MDAFNPADRNRNPLRYHRFFGRYLSNAALVDLRVAAVPFNI